MGRRRSLSEAGLQAVIKCQAKKGDLFSNAFAFNIICNLTAIYCQPLLTLTSKASSSRINAIVPTGFVDDILREENKC